MRKCGKVTFLNNKNKIVLLLAKYSLLSKHLMSDESVSPPRCSPDKNIYFFRLSAQLAATSTSLDTVKPSIEVFTITLSYFTARNIPKEQL